MDEGGKNVSFLEMDNPFTVCLQSLYTLLQTRSFWVFSEYIRLVADWAATLSL